MSIVRTLECLVCVVCVTDVGIAQNTQSATITNVVYQLSAGVPGAEQRFWRHLGETGSPIVERIANDPAHALVTFVVKANPKSRNVVAITPLSLIDVDSSKLSLIPGTSIWYRSFVLTRDARFTYRVGVDDPLIPFERDTSLFTRMKAWRLDEYNKKTVDLGFGIHASLLELDQAPGGATAIAQTKTSALPLAKGSLVIHGRQRPIWLYRSPNYRAGRDNHLLVFTDGDSYRSLISAPWILHDLVLKKRIPPVGAVFIDAHPEDRAAEYNCNEQFSATVVKQVIPWARRELQQTARGEVTVIGFSLGGLAAACVAVDYPASVAHVVAQSGAFYRGDKQPEGVARRIATMPLQKTRWSLDVGVYEIAAIPNRDPSMLTANRHLRDVLLAKGYDVNYTESAHGHEHAAWRAALPAALEWILAGKR